MNEIQESEFVLAICTQTYRRRFEGKEVVGKGRGVNLEGRAITESIYRSAAGNSKFIPVTFSTKDKKFIPLILQGLAYNASRPREYTNLYLRLTDQKPLIPPLGPVKRVSAERKGPVVTPALLGKVRSAQSFGISAMPLGRPKEPRRIALAEHAQGNSPEPVIYAKFELRNGKPVNRRGTYKIWVAVRNVPKGTEMVSYKILDDTFRDPKFSVNWGAKDFADWIKTYGDVFLSAKGNGKKGRWRTQTTLLDALKFSYGPRPTPIIRRAMQDIADN